VPQFAAVQLIPFAFPARNGFAAANKWSVNNTWKSGGGNKFFARAKRKNGTKPPQAGVGWEFRLQAVGRGNRLKPGLRTSELPNDRIARRREFVGSSGFRRWGAGTG